MLITSDSLGYIEVRSIEGRLLGVFVAYELPLRWYETHNDLMTEAHFYLYETDPSKPVQDFVEHILRSAVNV